MSISSISVLHFTFSPHVSSPGTDIRAGLSRRANLSFNSPLVAELQGDGRNRRVWRRRQLKKKDDFKIERVPFLEEQVRKIRDEGKLVAIDIHKLLLSAENKFAFVNEIAAEAIEYVEKDRDAYGGTKKAILHVLSNRMNEAGFYRPDAYYEPDPFIPGPGYLKDELR